MERLIQKDWIFGHPQSRCTSVSVSLWQKVHFSLLTSPIFFRKLLVDSLLYRNWNLKAISFVLFVHWNDNWYAVLQLIVMLISSSYFCWLEIGSSLFFDTSFLYTGLLGFEFSKKFDKKPSYFSGGLAFWGICLFKSLIADISPWKAKGRTFRLYLF